jgi:pSer/pThr/pTyr-binding forkhead associated (FHA) protein
MSDYMELTIDVFNEVGQRVDVLRTLTVDELIDEILHEFTELASPNRHAYALYLKGASRPLVRHQTLAAQGIRPHDELTFGWVQGGAKTGRLALAEPQKAAVREGTTGRVFPLEWQPAVIGRPHSNPAMNKLLAVNLDYLPTSRRVSRRHAQIVEENGRYYIEPLSETNPTFVNYENTPLQGKRPLQTGDRIRLGGSNIVLTFMLR